MTLFSTLCQGLDTEAAVPAMTGQYTDLPGLLAGKGNLLQPLVWGGLVTVAHMTSTVTAEGGFVPLHTLRSGPVPDGSCGLQVGSMRGCCRPSTAHASTMQRCRSNFSASREASASLNYFSNLMKYTWVSWESVGSAVALGRLCGAKRRTNIGMGAPTFLGTFLHMQGRVPGSGGLHTVDVVQQGLYARPRPEAG
ncbi:hypothetical protein VaNZ11_016637 [Volvox africanus]|uniref:Uncharacterized protein n=1 Tax=Volvox africanus TaxID=51714 RepID=A0ABQ5SPN2_9CHLO|nr:hypothetical protein VaNZ11_016637 [Volvox africanus]